MEFPFYYSKGVGVKERGHVPQGACILVDREWPLAAASGRNVTLLSEDPVPGHNPGMVPAGRGQTVTIP